MLETGAPLIIEGNFAPAGVKKTDEAGVIKSLIDKYNCEPLTYKFTGDTRVLHKRFTEREKNTERGRANIMYMEIAFDAFDELCRNLDGFDIGGETVMIDTTDFEKVDFERHIETARKFLKAENR
jgi:hypothetical protein